MRIDAPRNRARALYDGHCHPFLSQRFKGWHARPGKETVSSPLLAQLARSPSRTGRATFQPHGPADKHLNQLGTTTSQTRPQEPLSVSTTHIGLEDPRSTARPESHWQLWRAVVVVSPVLDSRDEHALRGCEKRGFRPRDPEESKRLRGPRSTVVLDMVPLR